MQRIVTYTRIHGKGDEFVINEMLKTEFKRQREKERKYITMLEEKNIKNLKGKMDELRAMVCPRCNKSRAEENLEYILACIFGWLEALGWIEYVHDDK